MRDTGELWTTGDIAVWLGISVPAVCALVVEEGFPLPLRGLTHSRRWSQTVVKEWVLTPRFAEREPAVPVNVVQMTRAASSIEGPLTVVERPLRSKGKRSA